MQKRFPSNEEREANKEEGVTYVWAVVSFGARETKRRRARMTVNRGSRIGHWMLGEFSLAQESLWDALESREARANACGEV